MKIAYVLNAYLPRSVGGTEFYTDALANYMKTRGVDPVVVMPGFGGANEAAADDEYNGIRVCRYSEPSKSNRRMILGLSEPEGLNNFVQLIRSENPDIVHFQMISSGAGVTVRHVEEIKKHRFITGLTLHLAHYTCLTETMRINNQAPCDGQIDSQKCTTCYLVNRGVSVKRARFLSLASRSLCSVLGQNPHLCGLPGLSVGSHVQSIKHRLRRLSSNLDFMIPVAEWYKEVLTRNGVPAEKITVISQGLIANCSHTPAESPVYSPPLSLVFIGRITPIKGLLVLLKAMANVPRDACRLDIYGVADTASSYVQECQQLIREQGLNASFRGIVQRDQVIAAMQKCHSLCLPSLFSEMSPLVIEEAFFARTPVIGTDVPGISERVKHEENGLLFKLGDHEALGRLLARIIEKPDVLLQLRKNIPLPHPFDLVGKKTLEIYNSALPKTSRS